MPPQGGFEETENSLEGNSDEAALPVSTPVLKLPELPYAGPNGDNLVQRFKIVCEIISSTQGKVPHSIMRVLLEGIITLSRHPVAY